MQADWYWPVEDTDISRHVLESDLEIQDLPKLDDTYIVPDIEDALWYCPVDDNATRLPIGKVVGAPFPDEI